jgi:endonuclease-3
MNIALIVEKLTERYPIGAFPGQNPRGEKRRNKDPYRVLISTILSQRTRDENTHRAVERLFGRFGNAEEIADADEKEIQELIKPSGFYRVKAKRIKEVSKIILEKYNGKVPNDLDALLSLPSVGRKTANCVLVFGFEESAIPVDTHVHRISNRLGLVNTKNVYETEKMLMKAVPKKYWNEINTLFVRFGQDICRPINPKCGECVIKHLCAHRT